MLIMLGVVLTLFTLLCVRYLIVRYECFYTFEKRMGFEMPDYVEITQTFEKEITIDNENLKIKYTIPEDKLEEFINILESSEYYVDETISDGIYPHVENTCPEWDLDYEMLDKIYVRMNVRYKPDFWCGKVMLRHCHKYFFILKPENGKATIYLYYYSNSY